MDESQSIKNLEIQKEGIGVSFDSDSQIVEGFAFGHKAVPVTVLGLLALLVCFIWKDHIFSMVIVSLAVLAIIWLIVKPEKKSPQFFVSKDKLTFAGVEKEEIGSLMRSWISGFNIPRLPEPDGKFDVITGKKVAFEPREKMAVLDEQKSIEVQISNEIKKVKSE
ncbi:MAG TPA: hypothetical protein DIS66_07255 [Candidatus Omnitrophica bacterium]|nr:hypothetical protein [Candidatus Omnitrophota bacterium]